MTKRRNGKRLATIAGLGVVVVIAGAAWVAWERVQDWRLLSLGFDCLGPNAQGFSEYKHRQSGIVFVRLPGGDFLMGGAVGENGEENQRPQHEVTLSPFLIAKFEVTRAQWIRVMESRDDPSENPMGNVSWYDAQEFCREAGLELPTEAQWEYACRGPQDGGTHSLDTVGWYEDSRPRGLQPVGQKEPNGFGLHDMRGNLWEWCEDSYDYKFYGKPEASSKDPVSLRGRRRVRRGGCWSSPSRNCHPAYRRSSNPSQRTALRGFRPAYPLG